ncbi:STAS domain-containing protein [Streptomyces sp. NPDC048362]|uniref:STAS domain-containing protein n=1 Tax=Streptomyces sp. NPDC048362 TaxID=3365539 RepID=UPI003715485D
MTDTARAELDQQPGGLSILSATTDGIRVLTATGEIDHHTGDALRQALDAAGTSCPRTVVDLARVTFMDSSGINIFIAAHRAATEAGGWLRLAAPTESVLRTLQIVGVDTVIRARSGQDPPPPRRHSTKPSA